MKKNNKKIVFIAWMLLVTLMPFYVVKVLHHHDVKCCSEEKHSSQKGGSHHDTDDCPICHFILSPFIESQPVRLLIFLTLIPADVVLYLNKKIYKVSYIQCLRAPPML